LPATDAFLVLLGIVHIATGVIWVGLLFVVVVFVQPSAATLGPAGAPFRRSFAGADLSTDRDSGIGVAASVTRPTIVRLVALATQVAGSRGKPSPEVGARIRALQRRLVVAKRASFSLVLLALVAMASARYL